MTVLAHPTCAMAVMAKAPRAGQVKTRLTPPLSPAEATAINAAFLHDISDNIRRAGSACQGFVAYAPTGAAHLFDGMLAPGTRLVLADGLGDMPEGLQGLGRCLLHAARSLFAQGHASVCLVNSDSPTLPTAILQHAAAVLARPGERMVIGPAEDGGYYLIGMKAPHAALFADIAWSTGSVTEQTIDRARALGLEPEILPLWYDVDDAAALRRLLKELAAPPHDQASFSAPATASCIERRGLRDRLAAWAAA